jgi:hypothetical protein
LGIRALTVDNPNTSYEHATFAVLDFASPAEPDEEDESPKTAQYGITGMVYSDLNGDGLYTPGEGIVGAEMLVNSGDSLNRRTTTNNTGGFAMLLDPAEYLITMAWEDIPVASVALDDANMVVFFTVEWPGEMSE